MTLSRLLPLALLTSACAPAPAPLTDAEHDAVTREVSATAAELVQAINDHDPERILGFYRRSPELVYLGCTNYAAGYDLYANLVTPYHRSHPEVTYRLQASGVRVLSRDVAVVGQQGEGWDSTVLFTTRVFVRSDQGAWQVAYEHESWAGCRPPAAPHPGSAAADTTLVPRGGEG